MTKYTFELLRIGIFSIAFDIVITDLLMPEMNGAELAEAIRSNPRYERIHILAMSTENESIMYDKKLFDKIMLKPIVRNALYNGIFADTQIEPVSLASLKEKLIPMSKNNPKGGEE